MAQTMFCCAAAHVQLASCSSRLMHMASMMCCSTFHMLVVITHIIPSCTSHTASHVCAAAQQFARSAWSVIWITLAECCSILLQQLQLPAAADTSAMADRDRSRSPPRVGMPDRSRFAAIGELGVRIHTIRVPDMYYSGSGLIIEVGSMYHHAFVCSALLLQSQ